MKHYVSDEKGFVSLIGMLIALCVVCYLCFIVFKTYFKNPALEQAAEETRSEHIIDTSSYQSIIESSKTAVEDYNKQTLKRQKQIEELGKDL